QTTATAVTNAIVNAMVPAGPGATIVAARVWATGAAVSNGMAAVAMTRIVSAGNRFSPGTRSPGASRAPPSFAPVATVKASARAIRSSGAIGRVSTPASGRRR